MAGGGVAHLARGGVDDGVDDRRPARARDAVRVAREQLQHARRRAPFERVRPQRAAQLAHRRGRLGPVPDDVADGDPEPPAGQLQRVVEVPARRGAVRGRQVAHRQLEPVRTRQSVGQQRLLERERQVVLGLVAPRPAERLPAQPRQRQQVVAVGGPERARRVEHEPDRPQRLAAVGQRQQRRRLRLRAHLAEARVAAEDRVRALQPQRRRGARGLGQRQLGVQRQRAGSAARVSSACPAACASSSACRSSIEQRHPRAVGADRVRALRPPPSRRPPAASAPAPASRSSPAGRGGAGRARAVERLSRDPAQAPPAARARRRRTRRVRAAHADRAQHAPSPRASAPRTARRRARPPAPGSARELAWRDRDRPPLAGGVGARELVLERDAEQLQRSSGVVAPVADHPQLVATVERPHDPAGAAERAGAVLGHRRADLLGRGRPGERGRHPEQRPARRAAWSGPSVSVEWTVPVESRACDR